MEGSKDKVKKRTLSLKHDLACIRKVESTVERLKFDAGREYIQVVLSHSLMSIGFSNIFVQLKDLLDLKQKQASIAESVSTSEQGKTVLIFTIVTVIFVRTLRSGLFM